MAQPPEGLFCLSGAHNRCSGLPVFLLFPQGQSQSWTTCLLHWWHRWPKPRLRSCVSAAGGPWQHINLGPTWAHCLIPCLPGAWWPWPGSQGGHCRMSSLPSLEPQLSVPLHRQVPPPPGCDDNSKFSFSPTVPPQAPSLLPIPLRWPPRVLPLALVSVIHSS